jgi:hypothetical protein
MVGAPKFLVFVAASILVFVGVVWFVLRKRASVSWPLLLSMALLVVAGGMTFARWGQQIGLPWWIYYTAPAFATFLLPPLVFRMSSREAATYLGLAVLMAPAIHLFFGFFIGWPEYMPFIPVRSLSSILRDYRVN